eukprot:TRINITY_DN14495_c0_g1_i1.p1 TRINITY_DN14495_c0_g1~~TRINITY_DN14495_c0_g1_i1.p1  ORF type:complete len:454 (+),score=178.36 TRINITY_DN14495_c0_g1_i1:90-1451(+)
MDAITRHIVHRIIAQIRAGEYRFTPIEVVDMTSRFTEKKTRYVAAVNSKDVSPEADRLLLHALVIVLEAVYEPTFSPSSYGFRPATGCHDALSSVKVECRYAQYWLTADMTRSVVECDPAVIEAVLREQIPDPRLIALIMDAIRAGHLKNWQHKPGAIAGLPEGSILGPLLGNILLDRFDWFVNRQLQPLYTRGIPSPPDRTYNRLMGQARFAYARFNATQEPADEREGEELQRRADDLPGDYPQDPTYRRLHYARCGPQWLMGFAGPPEEAEHLRMMCQSFAACVQLGAINVTLCPSTQPAHFLGADIVTFRKRLSNRLSVKLSVSFSYLIQRLVEGGFARPENGEAINNNRLYGAEKDAIVQRVAELYLGVLSYYSFAANHHKMSRFLFMTLRNSCAKTLAAKYKLRSVHKVIAHFGKHLGGGGKVALPDPADVVSVTPFTPGPLRPPALR